MRAISLGPLIIRCGGVELSPFAVPSFDLNSLGEDAKHDLVQTLETSGIVAARGIPNFASVRLNYLQSAAECASDAKDFDQLLHKEIDDGTQRRTLSINMEALDPAVAARCPSFAENGCSSIWASCETHLKLFGFAIFVKKRLNLAVVMTAS
ncbi:hypothetical protein AC1031_009242 [Aphanomyces cochlioides]|nr:hypothetical protein AC1031_009242 [Aphanomyces cochlioides]